MVSSFFTIALLLASSLVGLDARAIDRRDPAPAQVKCILDMNGYCTGDMTTIADGAPAATTKAPVATAAAAKTTKAAANPTSKAAANPTSKAAATAAKTSKAAAAKTTKPAAAATKAPASSGGKKVVAYFGQSAGKATFDSFCADPNLDIIVISFLNKFWGAGGLPGSNHAGYCSGKIAGTDLTACPEWEKTIKACQAKGKKVLLSMGGATLEDTIPSADKAKTLAENVWKLYGDGTGLESKRPFGTASVDGFDLDIENKHPENYPAFISAMRTLFKTSKKQYILTGAPQCVNPDASLGDSVNLLDHLYIQFYNNPGCSNANLVKSAQQWSAQLASKSTVKTQMFVGIPGDPTPNSAGSGYLKKADLTSYVAELKKLSNFAGLMTWSAETATANTAEGGSYLSVMKNVLK